MSTRLFLSAFLTLALLLASSGTGEAQVPVCQGLAATIWGDDLDNVLTGTAGGDVIAGLRGNDTIDGMGGSDVICGDDGDDKLSGNTGADSLEGGAGTDHLDGGGGRDTATYRTSPSGVDASLTTGTASDGFGTSDTFAAIEFLAGSRYGDLLTGNAGANRLIGDSGGDTLDGMGGSDTAFYQTSPAGVDIDLSVGTGADGFGFTDTLLNLENVTGSSFDDIFTGRAGLNNAFSGLAGNDFFDDASSADFDSAFGGPGVDTCTLNIESCTP